MIPLLRSIHYGWCIVLSCILTVIAVLGLGRFSLGMLLPSMGADLGLSYSQMGFISTGNFLGYLAGVLVSSRLVRKFGYRIVISGGIFLVGSSMIFMGLGSGFQLILGAFFCTGIGSGLANVPAMVLVSHWFGSSLRGRAAGMVVSGIGIGIMCTGLLVPAVNSWATSVPGWRLNWMLLGALVLLSGVLCAVLIRERPQDLGLQVLEKSGTKKEGGQQRHHGKEQAALSSKQIICHLGGIYFFFGFTYVIYVTFVVTTLIAEYQYSEAVAGRFWFWFGLLGIFSGPVFGSLSDRLGRAGTLALVFVLQGGAHLLLALNPWAGSIYLSIGLFALCAWSVPSIVAAAVGDYLGPLRAASGFAMVTFLFGIGQIAGPSMAGVLAEKSGSFAGGYLLAAFFTVIAATLSLFLPPGKE